MNKKDQESLWCEYSDLPSPLAYSCTDYDSMGNHGRFPKIKKKGSFKEKINRWIKKKEKTK